MMIVVVHYANSNMIVNFYVYNKICQLLGMCMKCCLNNVLTRYKSLSRIKSANSLLYIEQRWSFRNMYVSVCVPHDPE